MKIQKYMVDKFNEIMKDKNSIIRLKFVEGEYTTKAEVILEDIFIENCIINLNNKFYDILENYFLQYNIVLGKNNTWTTFWSTDFNDENKPTLGKCICCKSKCEDDKYVCKKCAMEFKF